MKRFEIRKLIGEDTTAINKLSLGHPEFRCVEYDDTWSKEELINWVSSKEDICACAVDQRGKIIGYCLTHFHKAANKVYIENIYVMPRYRRLGVGKNLIEYIKNQYSKNIKKIDHKYRFIAVVLKNNRSALDFFRNLNFNIGEQMIWVQLK